MMPAAKFDFIGKRKVCYIISIAIMVVGIIFNIIFGTTLDISFKGGSLISYTFTGELTVDEVQDVLNADDAITASVTASITETAEENINNLTVSVIGNGELTPELQDAITNALTTNEALVANEVTFVESNSVDATMGAEFLGKCIAALVLASALMIIYIGIRFRKIGGWSAGVMAVVALLHDVAIAYFTFVICRLEINDNFFAVVLTIVGYSLNATIVIYDRVRENRRIYGPKANIADVVNLSINQSFTRAINTSITTLLTIGSVAVFAVIFKIDAIISFAVPLMLGIISGCYSSIFISNGLWVSWKEHCEKKKAAKK